MGKRPEDFGESWAFTGEDGGWKRPSPNTVAASVDTNDAAMSATPESFLVGDKLAPEKPGGGVKASSRSCIVGLDVGLPERLEGGVSAMLPRACGKLDVVELGTLLKLSDFGFNACWTGMGRLAVPPGRAAAWNANGGDRPPLVGDTAGDIGSDGKKCGGDGGAWAPSCSNSRDCCCRNICWRAWFNWPSLRSSSLWMKWQRGPYGQKPIVWNVLQSSVLYLGCRLSVLCSCIPCANWHFSPYLQWPLSSNGRHSSVLYRLQFMPLSTELEALLSTLSWPSCRKTCVCTRPHIPPRGPIRPAATAGCPAREGGRRGLNPGAGRPVPPSECGLAFPELRELAAEPPLLWRRRTPPVAPGIGIPQLPNRFWKKKTKKSS